MRRRLSASFDALCAESFCAGELTDLTTLRIACASSTGTHALTDCLWLLAGNVDQIDGSRGALGGEAGVLACHVPVAGVPSIALLAFEGGGVRAALITLVP